MQKGLQKYFSKTKFFRRAQRTSNCLLETDRRGEKDNK